MQYDCKCKKDIAVYIRVRSDCKLRIVQAFL